MKRISLILIIFSIYSCLEIVDYSLKRKLQVSTEIILSDITYSSNIPSDLSNQPLENPTISDDIQSNPEDIPIMPSDWTSTDLSEVIEKISKVSTDLSSITTEKADEDTSTISSMPNESGENLSSNISITTSEIIDFPSDESNPSSEGINSTDNNYSKYILVGFDSYNRVPERNIIIFFIYFRRILGIIPKFLTFPINIRYLERLRGLEDVKKDITCVRESKENDDNMYFNCSLDVDDKNISKISVENNFIFNETDSDVILSSLANKTMDNIQEQTGDQFKRGYIILKESELEQNYKTNFKLKGESSETIKDKKVTLCLDEKGNGILKNVTCDTTNKGNNKYELSCSSNNAVTAHLNGVSGVTSDKTILVEMKEGKPDLVEIYSSKNRFNKNSSSSGLTAGAIVGIIFACLVALAAVAVVIVLCNTKPKISEKPATLELYHSTTSEI